jgi:hypothetical protein
MNTLITPKQLWQFLYMPDFYKNPLGNQTEVLASGLDCGVDLNWFNSPSRLAVASGWQSFDELAELVGLVCAKTVIRKEIRGAEVRVINERFTPRVIEQLIFGSSDIDDLVNDRLRICRRFSIKNSPSSDLNLFGSFGFLLFASLNWPAAVKQRLSLMAPASWLKSVPRPLILSEVDLNRMVEFVNLAAREADEN